MGIAICSKVKELIDGQDYVRKTELSAIGLLSMEETEKVVDSVLYSSEAAAITGKLSKKQFSFVEQQFLNMPAEPYKILKELLIAENYNKRAEKASKKNGSGRREK